jgi:hypothetical protein
MLRAVVRLQALLGLRSPGPAAERHLPPLPTRDPRSLALLAAALAGTPRLLGDGSAVPLWDALWQELEATVAEAGARPMAGRMAIAGLVSLSIAPRLSASHMAVLLRGAAERTSPHVGHVTSVFAQLNALPDPYLCCGSVRASGLFSRPCLLVRTDCADYGHRRAR